MRRSVLLIAGLIFCAFNLDGQSPLQQLSETHQFFRLRDAVGARQTATTDFYTGEVACAFNQTAACKEAFKRVLSANSTSATAKQIHHILAYVALREGRYTDALRQFDAILAIDPNDSDARDTRPIVEGLSHFPNTFAQTGDRNNPVVHMDGGKLPLAINRHKAFFYFDTGANLSTIAESEASRFGMEIRDVTSGGAMHDINANKVSLRLALANTIELAAVQLHDVAFLVVSDQQQPFVNMKPGERGLIGLPVLLALRSVKWTKAGTFESAAGAPVDLATANICFDDLSLVTQARFGPQNLPFVLDTGAATTELWPTFQLAAADMIRNFGTDETHTVSGVGGSQEFKSIALPNVTLELGGQSVTLKPAHILKSYAGEPSRWYYGNLGVDLLKQANSVTLDFRSMILTLEPSRAH
ncbi:MAG TPA: aspartyl protease family protein [Terriglobales bacterium]|nr:aspartyl protease family protein [Terriglobales bacterium]